MREQLRQTMDGQRNRQFVGRAWERAWLHDWLSLDHAKTGMAWITGMGGIGKTSLLQVMLQEAGQSGAAAHYLDCRACNCSPSGLLEYLALLLAPDGPGRWAAIDAMQDQVAGGRRVVLGLDDAEVLGPIAGWIREEFCARLPGTGILLLCAARQPWSGRLDPFWQERLQHLPLSPLSTAESRELLAMSPLQPVAKERLLREAGGHPLTLSVGATINLTTAEPLTLSALISAELLQEVSAPDLHALLEILALVPEADQDELSGLHGQPVSPDQFLRLAELSFVTRHDGRLTLHHVARESLLADLGQRAPRRLQLLRRRAANQYRTALRRVSTRLEQARLHAALLALSQDAFPSEQAFGCQGGPTYPRIDSATWADREIPQAMLADWGSNVMGMSDLADEHNLLDTLLQRSPESVRVLRSPEGAPLAFLVVVLLHRETVAILDGFRLGRLLVDQPRPAERQRLECTPEEADSYFGLMGGTFLVDGQPGSTGWLNVLFRDHLACLGERRRLIGIASNPEVLAFLRRLGYRARPESINIGGAPWPFRLMELDLRDHDFADWVVSWLDAVEGPEPIGESQAVSDRAIVAALPLLEDPRLLERSGLATQLGQDGVGLQSLLRIGLARLHPDEQAVLTLASGAPHLAPEAAATRLHLSRATYYRRRRTGLANLAAWLAAPLVV